jgi:hypothetical protein
MALRESLRVAVRGWGREGGRAIRSMGEGGLEMITEGSEPAC